MSSTKKPAKLAIDKKAIDADALSKRNCFHCGDRIKVVQLMPVRSIRFQGASSTSRMVHYSRDHYGSK
jgi:hypothetical protein